MSYLSDQRNDWEDNPDIDATPRMADEEYEEEEEAVATPKPQLLPDDFDSWKKQSGRWVSATPGWSAYQIEVITMKRNEACPSNHLLRSMDFEDWSSKNLDLSTKSLEELDEGDVTDTERNLDPGIGFLEDFDEVRAKRKAKEKRMRRKRDPSRILNNSFTNNFQQDPGANQNPFGSKVFSSFSHPEFNLVDKTRFQSLESRQRKKRQKIKQPIKSSSDFSQTELIFSSKENLSSIKIQLFSDITKHHHHSNDSEFGCRCGIVIQIRDRENTQIKRELLPDDLDDASVHPSSSTHAPPSHHLRNNEIERQVPFPLEFQSKSSRNKIFRSRRSKNRSNSNISTTTDSSFSPCVVWGGTVDASKCFFDPPPPPTDQINTPSIDNNGRTSMNADDYCQEMYITRLEDKSRMRHHAMVHICSHSHPSRSLGSNTPVTSQESEEEVVKSIPKTQVLIRSRKHVTIRLRDSSNSSLNPSQQESTDDSNPSVLIVPRRPPPPSPQASSNSGEINLSRRSQDGNNNDGFSANSDFKDEEWKGLQQTMQAMSIS